MPTIVRHVTLNTFQQNTLINKYLLYYSLLRTKQFKMKDVRNSTTRLTSLIRLYLIMLQERTASIRGRLKRYWVKSIQSANSCIHVFWIYVLPSLVCMAVVKCFIISLIVSDETAASVPCGRSSADTIGATALRCIDAADLLPTDMQWQLITRLCLNRIDFQILGLLHWS